MARRSRLIVPPRKRRRWTDARDYRVRSQRRPGGFVALLIILPLAVFTVVFVWGGPPLAGAFQFPKPAVGAPDRERASFSRCSGPVRVNCVVDGDTLWYRGEKIRIADINAPEVSEPRCASEARLGARATDRLQALLNEGAFTLGANDDGTGRDRDRYGRLLRTVTRNGESLGEVLVREGLAEEWNGVRRRWC